MKKIVKYSTVCTIIVLIFGGFVTYVLLKPPTLEQLFNRATNHVVEVKAQKENDIRVFGSAVLLDNSGQFVTNAHVVTFVQMGVVKQFDEYFVRFSFEANYREVSLVKFDRDIDLALLQIVDMPSFRLQAVEISNNTIRSGQTVFAVGNSLNHGVAISQGLVSLPLVRIEYEGSLKEVIQASITITEGNSGGALLDNRGRLIGITTFRLRDSMGVPIFGMVYCVPVGAVLGFK